MHADQEGEKSLQVVSALSPPCKPSQQCGWDCARREGEASGLRDQGELPTVSIILP